MLATAGFAVSDIVDHRQALAQTADLLDQLRGRQPRGGEAASLASEHPGTPFLEGPTVTVAGARLPSVPTSVAARLALLDEGTTPLSSPTSRTMLRDGPLTPPPPVLRPPGCHRPRRLGVQTLEDHRRAPARPLVRRPREKGVRPMGE